MTGDRQPVRIVAARRTPIGTAGRALASVPAHELAAAALRAVREDVGADPSEVVLGNCLGPGGNLARVSALAANLPDDVAALTVDRQCASGLAAIGVAAATLGPDAPVFAGGVESASTAPWRSWPPVGDRPPQRYQRAPFAPTPDQDPDMGLAADVLASDRGIDRAAQDAYAARSHQRAWATLRDGGFAAETVDVGGLTDDERPREGLTSDRLARLRPMFPDPTSPGRGTVTAGNSCGINDGAAVVALARSDQEPGLDVLACTSAGVDPTRPGLGLVPAVRRALANAGLGLDDLDVIEFNEAFAGQMLACADELGLDPSRICPEGGALALGHPWGASGAVLVVRLFSQMIGRGRGRYGLAAISAGGGQGTAMVVRACR